MPIYSEDNWITRNRRTLLRMLGALLVVAALYYVRRDLLDALQPFFYGAILAFLFNPLAEKLDAIGVKRWQSALLMAFLLLLIVGLFVGVFIPSVVRDALQLAQRLPSGIATLRVTYQEEIARVTDWMSDLGTDIPGDLGARLGSIITNALGTVVKKIGGIFQVLLTPVISFYFIKDKRMILAGLRDLFNPRQQRMLSELWVEIHRVLTGYVKGRLLVSVYIGVATGLGCLVIGLPNTLTIGIVTGLFDLIPYFGPWLGGTLPVLIALMGPDPIIKAIWVVLLIVVVQQVEINLITPRIISENVGLHPLLVMFSVIFFGRVMGIPGMIIGVPVMGSLIALFFYIRSHNQSSDMSDEDASPKPSEDAEPEPSATASSSEPAPKPSDENESCENDVSTG